tara:strand:+ start:114 stop:434 length:321 start_codon:yes stop_codon:yes gene_type:complete
MLIEFEDKDFHDKIKNEDKSIIYFSATWCGPCRVQKPLMEKFSETLKDKVNIYYADVDNAINTSTENAIRGVPTVICYNKGQEAERLVGGVPESKLKEFLDNFLSN